VEEQPVGVVVHKLVFQKSRRGVRGIQNVVIPFLKWEPLLHTRQLTPWYIGFVGLIIGAVHNMLWDYWDLCICNETHNLSTGMGYCICVKSRHRNVLMHCNKGDVDQLKHKGVVTCL
jgi:hypothetical protein